MAILGFNDTGAEHFFLYGKLPKTGWNSIGKIVARKLDQLNAASELKDLKAPPGNRLEALRGNRQGQWSIRINGQWRLCFRWTYSGPDEVEIVDYH